jgi:hypothetical protein
VTWSLLVLMLLFQAIPLERAQQQTTQDSRPTRILMVASAEDFGGKPGAKSGAKPPEQTEIDYNERQSSG